MLLERGGQGLERFADNADETCPPGCRDRRLTLISVVARMAMRKARDGVRGEVLVGVRKFVIEGAKGGVRGVVSSGGRGGGQGCVRRNVVDRERGRGQGTDQERGYFEVPGFGGDGTFARLLGVALREKICAACSRTVTAGNRVLRLPYPVGEHVLHTRCALDNVGRAPVGNTLRCPAEACGARHSCELVVIDVARVDPYVRGRFLDFEGSLGSLTLGPRSYAFCCKILRRVGRHLSPTWIRQMPMHPLHDEGPPRRRSESGSLRYVHPASVHDHMGGYHSLYG